MGYNPDFIHKKEYEKEYNKLKEKADVIGLSRKEFGMIVTLNCYKAKCIPNAIEGIDNELWLIRSRQLSRDALVVE